MSQPVQKRNANGGRKASQGNRPQQSKKPRARKSNGNGKNKTMSSQEIMPTSFSRGVKTYSPIEKTGPRGSRSIKYKEYVQDIAGSVAFATTQFQVNPGLSNLFAWLAGQALFYQEYTLKSLKFCFETEKATTLSGKVMFAFLQDSADAAPASKQEMLENLLKASGAIWQAFSLSISMQNFPALGRSRFIRSGSLAANLDVKTYDIGQLIVATQGMADATLAGELYVEYEIELRTPLQSAAQFATALSAKVVGLGSVAEADWMGLTPVLTGGLDITPLSDDITFNRVGQYLVSVRVAGTGLFTTYAPTWTISTGGTATAIPGISNAAANAGTLAMFSGIVTVTARGQVLNIDLTSQSTTVSASEVRISMFSASLG